LAFLVMCPQRAPNELQPDLIADVQRVSLRVWPPSRLCWVISLVRSRTNHHHVGHRRGHRRGLPERQVGCCRLWKASTHLPVITTRACVHSARIHLADEELLRSAASLDDPGSRCSAVSLGIGNRAGDGQGGRSTAPGRAARESTGQADVQHRVNVIAIGAVATCATALTR
jgi:hypothetical protein